MESVNDLVECYVAVWNEADATRRRSGVGEIWTEDAVHIVEPPGAVREAASDLNLMPRNWRLA
jgi:hypothetical protein